MLTKEEIIGDVSPANCSWSAGQAKTVGHAIRRIAEIQRVVAALREAECNRWGECTQVISNFESECYILKTLHWNAIFALANASAANAREIERLQGLVRELRDERAPAKYVDPEGHAAWNAATNARVATLSHEPRDV